MYEQYNLIELMHPMVERDDIDVVNSDSTISSSEFEHPVTPRVPFKRLCYSLLIRRE